MSIDTEDKVLEDLYEVSQQALDITELNTQAKIQVIEKALGGQWSSSAMTVGEALSDEENNEIRLAFLEDIYLNKSHLQKRHLQFC